MARWLPIPLALARQPGIAERSAAARLVHLALRVAHSEHGRGGHVPKQYAGATGLALVSGSWVVGVDIAAALVELEQAGLIAANAEGVTIKDFDPETELPICKGCDCRNPDHRDGPRCRACRARDKKRPRRPRAESAQGPRETRAKPATPPHPTGPHQTESNPTTHAPQQGMGVPESNAVPGDRNQNGAPAREGCSVEGNQPGERSPDALFAVLTATSLRSLSGNRRQALVKIARELDSQGMSSTDLQKLVALAKIESSGDPGGLLSDWLSNEVTWREKLGKPNDGADAVRGVIGTLNRRFRP